LYSFFYLLITLNGEKPNIIHIGMGLSEATNREGHKAAGGNKSGK
jgi:hypothetical protein